MFCRRTLLRVARGLLGVFLLSQATLAAAACEWTARSPAKAVQMGAGVANAPCHETALPDPGATHCLAQCLSGDQSLDKPVLYVPALACEPVLKVEPVALRTEAGIASLAIPAPATGPPLRILFRSFLI